MKFMKLFVAILVVCACTVPAMAEECRIPTKLKDLPVGAISMEATSEGYLYVVFSGVELDGLPGHPRADVRVYMGRGDFSIKVRRNPPGNALNVRYRFCEVYPDSKYGNPISMYAGTGDVTFFVNSRSQREQWKEWLDEARASARRQWTRERQRTYRRILPPSMKD
jgi:hypothetical protein